MKACQGGLTPNASWGLQTRRLGPLPLINHMVSRLQLDERLERFVPTQDRRVRLAYAKGLGVLLRSILVEREPIYRQHETVATFAEEAFGLDAEQVMWDGEVIEQTLYFLKHSSFLHEAQPLVHADGIELPGP